MKIEDLKVFSISQMPQGKKSDVEICHSKENGRYRLFIRADGVVYWNGGFNEKVVDLYSRDARTAAAKLFGVVPAELERVRKRKIEQDRKERARQTLLNLQAQAESMGYVLVKQTDAQATC